MAANVGDHSRMVTVASPPFRGQRHPNVSTKILLWHFALTCVWKGSDRDLPSIRMRLRCHSATSGEAILTMAQNNWIAEDCRENCFRLATPPCLRFPARIADIVTCQTFKRLPCIAIGKKWDFAVIRDYSRKQQVRLESGVHGCAVPSPCVTAVIPEAISIGIVLWPTRDHRARCFSSAPLIALQSRSNRSSQSADRTDAGSLAIFWRNNRAGRVL